MSAPARQHRSHLLVDQVDGLERAQHHLEVDDPAGIVPADHVDAVDAEAVDLDLELERRVVCARDLANVAEALGAEDPQRRRELFGGDRLA